MYLKIRFVFNEGFYVIRLYLSSWQICKIIIILMINDYFDLDHSDIGTKFTRPKRRSKVSFEALVRTSKRHAIQPICA